MSGNSRPVVSSQDGLHPSLSQVVQKHLAGGWRQPFAEHNAQAFARLDQWRQQQGMDRPLWLDSGCGTARAGVTLARAHPQALVVAIDQSAARLQRGEQRFFPLPDNVLLLRAECADLWRLMVQAGWRIDRHFLLYPNPWPKPGHLQRRWHGHPVFPDLLALGGRLELRSNWPLYVEEMAVALALSGHAAQAGPFHPDEPLTDFEDKYSLSGHGLWRLISCLD
jgi:tRNA (guanine-N7-)-methyltransferase